MAACGSLQHIFEKPLPESPTLLDSLSTWNHIKSMKPLQDSSSFTEIFGELHFKEKVETAPPFPIPVSSPTALSTVRTEFSPQDGSEKLDDKNSINDDNNNKKGSTTNYTPTPQRRHYRQSDSSSSMNSESLSLCTEGLGFESFDDVEDSKSDSGTMHLQHLHHHHHHHHERRRSLSAISTTTKHMQTEYLCGEPKRSWISGVEFPPPISCIGRSGKPWVCFKSYRNNGRFILKEEVKFPTQEFLHACREDGRLKLQFIQSDDEIIEEDEDEDDLEQEERENEEKGYEEHDGDDDCDESDEEENNAGKDGIIANY